MADDHAPPQPPQAFDVETDEGLSAYLEDLYARKGVPERLRYPETPEAYERMLAEAEASGYVPADEAHAWLRSLDTPAPLPRPRPR